MSDYYLKFIEEKKTIGWKNLIIFTISFLLIHFFTIYILINSVLIQKIIIQSKNLINDTLLAYLFSFLILIAIIIFFILKISLKDLGINKKGIVPAIIILTSSILSINIYEYLYYNKTSLYSFITIHSWQRLLSYIITNSFVALNEEIIIRGFILTQLILLTKNRFSPLIPIIITALLFSIAHTPSLISMEESTNTITNSLINTFIGGIFLGLIYLYYNNLLIPIVLHFIINLSFFLNAPYSIYRSVFIFSSICLIFYKLLYKKNK